jgi:cell division protein FtsW (lipid II flippase)
MTDRQMSYCREPRDEKEQPLKRFDWAILLLTIFLTCFGMYLIYQSSVAIAIKR